MKFQFLLFFLASLLASSLQAQEYIKDIDGNKYEVFEHNGYLIMAENLKTTRFRDGTKIKKTNGYGKWEEGIDAGNAMYCYFENMKAFVDEGGYLYSPEAVRSDLGLAPEGWHIPTYEEWQKIFFKGDETEANNIYSITFEILKEDQKRAKKYNNELHVSRKFAAFGSGYRKENGYFSKAKEFSTTHLAMADGESCFELGLMGRGIGSHLYRALPSSDAGIAVRAYEK